MRAPGTPLGLEGSSSAGCIKATVFSSSFYCGCSPPFGPHPSGGLYCLGTLIGPVRFTLAAGCGAGNLAESSNPNCL